MRGAEGPAWLCFLLGCDLAFTVGLPAGVEVPSKDSVPKKKPVYGDKRKRKPNVHTPEGARPNKETAALFKIRLLPD